MGGKTYDDAIEEYQNLFPNDAALAYMQMNMAMADHDSLKLYTSIDALDKSIGGDPYLDIIRSDISYSYQNTVKARSYLEKALKTDPDLEDAYWRLVGLLIDGGKYDDAVAYFPKMKELFKVNPANFLPRDEYNGFWQAESYKKWAEKNPIDSSMLDAQQIAPQMPFDEEGADGHEGHGH
jgi:tetratricopeptide (TPR) repeat protein